MDESELDELLQRAIDPHVPVELFYAVLDRIGRLPAAASPAPLRPAAPAALPAGAPAAEAQPAEFGADTDFAADFAADLDPDFDDVPLPDADALMEQVDQLEAAMAAD